MDTVYTEHHVLIVNETAAAHKITLQSCNIALVSHSDVVEEFGHVFDDVTVLWRLSLQKFLDDNDALCNNSLYEEKKHMKNTLISQYTMFLL